MRFTSNAARTLAQLYRSAMRNELLDVAAQMAFWQLLAILPFGVLLLSLIAWVPVSGLNDQLMVVTHSLLPEDVIARGGGVLASIVGHQHGGVLALLLASALWSASAGISGTITALNRAYGVTERRPYWRVKLLSLFITFDAAFLLIVVIGALAIGTDLAHSLFAQLGGSAFLESVIALLRWPIITMAMTATLALAYHLLPDAQRRFRLFGPGTLVAVAGWIAASLLFKVYVGHVVSYDILYGALGVIAALMVWLYLSSLMILIGAEVNALFERRHDACSARTSHSHRQGARPMSDTLIAVNPKEFVTREQMLLLLSEDEVARVSTRESSRRLADGDQYIDLERLDEGVRLVQADSKLVQSRVIPRSAVGESTWDKLVERLVARAG